jgi:hypothetical protein
MIRHCDGNDPNLHAQDGQPCSCGAVFDDVDHRVIYPHEEIRHPSAAVLAQLAELMRNSATPPRTR